MEMISYFDIRKKRIIKTSAKGLPSDRYVELSKKQTKFKKDNPNASYQEIWACTLKVILPPDIELCKNKKINEFSTLSLSRQRELMPDYKLNNALTGIYGSEESEQTILEYRRIGILLRDEFYRVKELVLQSKTVEEINDIHANFNEIC